MVDSQLSIRFMTPDDAPLVEAFYSPLIPTKLDSGSYRELATSSSFSLLLVETADGKPPRIVGLCSAIRIWKTSYTREREAYLPAIGMLGKFRKRGLGSLLLNLTLSILRTHYQCGYVMAHVQKVANQNAFHFFRKKGFFAQKVCPAFYQLRSEKGGPEDALFLARDLSGWDAAVAIPEAITVDPAVQTMLGMRQKLGLLARWRSEP
jgi:ribosomal protein S18 acetylase RimI-like enzyme